MLLLLTMILYLCTEAFRVLNENRYVHQKCAYTNIHVYLLTSILCYIIIMMSITHSIYNNFNHLFKIYIVACVINLALTIWGYIELHQLVCNDISNIESVTFSNGLFITQTVISIITNIANIIYIIIKLIDKYTIHKYKETRKKTLSNINNV